MNRGCKLGNLNIISKLFFFSTFLFRNRFRLTWPGLKIWLGFCFVLVCVVSRGVASISSSWVQMEVLLSPLPRFSLTTFAFPFAEERIHKFVQKGQQHLQHCRHHLRHERGQRPGLDHHFQERRRSIGQAVALHVQNRRPLHGGQEVVQPRQQSGQDITHHLPSSVLYLQPGLLGHVCQQKAGYHEGKQPKLNFDHVLGNDLVWCEG